LRHFCRGGLAVQRAYLCRKPTLETVMLLLDLFGGELAALYLELRVEGAQADVCLGRFLEAFARRGDDAAAVLATCCEGAGPPAAFVRDVAGNRDLILECARACLAQVDVAAVLAELPLAEMFERAKEESESEPAPEPGIQPDGLTPLLCARFHASPAEVARWPYDGYLAALKSLGPADGDEDTDSGAGAPGVIAIGGKR